ncbi:hypothetical protein JB92DRAFT_3140748 [Gautieria morchelliformis]|nr:hypothetical protein JB92DRAFT_3140748 [Gautieria morchelliformis]
MPANPRIPAGSQLQGTMTLATNQVIPQNRPSRSSTPSLTPLADPGDPAFILRDRGMSEDNKTDISALAAALKSFGDFKRGNTWNVGKEGATQLVAITRLLREASLLYGTNRLATNNDLQKVTADIKEAISTGLASSPAISYAAAAKKGLGGTTSQAASPRQKMLAEFQEKQNPGMTPPAAQSVRGISKSAAENITLMFKTAEDAAKARAHADKWVSVMIHSQIQTEALASALIREP